MDTTITECECCEIETDCIDGLCLSCSTYIHHLEKNQKNLLSQLRTENEQLKEALEKLARLGNEPHLGNSEGNVIAQQALKDCDAD